MMKYRFDFLPIIRSRFFSLQTNLDERFIDMNYRDDVVYAHGTNPMIQNDRGEYPLMPDTHTQHIEKIKQAKTQLREINNFMDLHAKEYRELLVLENLVREAWTPKYFACCAPSELDAFLEAMIRLDGIREQQKELANATA